LVISNERYGIIRLPQNVSLLVPVKLFAVRPSKQPTRINLVDRASDPFASERRIAANVAKLPELLRRR